MKKDQQEKKVGKISSSPEATGRKRSRWLRVSLVLNLLLFLWACTTTYWARYPIMTWIRDHRTNRVVFLGDSLTAGGGNWDWRLGRWDTLNLGGNAFIVQHVQGMAQAKILKKKIKPECCFVMAGINDLTMRFDVDMVKKHYASLLDMLRRENIPTVIQLTLYRRAGVLSDKVDDLNAFLRDYAKKHDMIVVDLNPKLSENRKLKDEYTTDGVHLTKSAYAIWGEEVKKVLRKMNLE